MVIFMMRILNFLLGSFSSIKGIRSNIFSNVYEMYLAFELSLDPLRGTQIAKLGSIIYPLVIQQRYCCHLTGQFDLTIEITFHQEFLLGLSVSHLTRHMLLGSLSPLNTYTEITPHLTKMSYCSSPKLSLYKHAFSDHKQGKREIDLMRKKLYPSYTLSVQTF